MQKAEQFSLERIINTDILQEIQDKFSETTGLSAVIVNAEGEPVTKPSNFTSFCQYIRSFPEGLARCIGCDNSGGHRALAIKSPVVYLCHAGLTDLAAPIIVQGVYIGAFLAGQVVQERKDYDARDGMLGRVADMGLDQATVLGHFAKVDVVAERRLKAAADLIYIMSNYIVEIGAANIMQRQLTHEVQAKADLENLLRAAELKALQSQVNPHFLFNTLNTIARMALLEGATKTQGVVYALADILRSNLRDLDRLRQLKEEVRTIQDYLHIQHMRFSDRIQAFIDIQAGLMDALIPPLILQPLVENAIIHGLEGRASGGEIHLKGRLAENQADMWIEVIDTGTGIPSDQLWEIFQEKKNKLAKGHTTGLGILNVHKRIQHFFGSQYGLTMDSTPGRGTKVSIYLPYRHD